MAPFAGTIDATNGGFRSTVWKVAVVVCDGWRPKMSLTLELTVAVICDESGSVPVKVASLPSVERLPLRDKLDPFAVKDIPDSDCSGLLNAILMGWLTGTPVEPSAGSNEITARGVSFSTTLPRSNVCPF